MIENYTEKTLVKSLFTSFRPHWNVPKHTHVFWEFTYSVTGTVKNFINDIEIECKPLDKIILIKPGDTHRIQPVKNDSDSTKKFYRDIYVFPEKMKAICDMLSPTLYESFLNSGEPIIIDTAECNFSSLEHSLNILQSNNSYASEDMQKLDSLHTSVVFQVLGFYLQSKFEIQKDYPQWIRKFFDNMKNEDYLCKSVGEIIKDYHYSRGYICKEFKKYVGKTMIQCINESRINYSTTLLMDKSETVLDIAMRLNYNSQSAYINAFKQIHHISPGKWREQKLNT